MDWNYAGNDDDLWYLGLGAVITLAKRLNLGVVPALAQASITEKGI